LAIKKMCYPLSEVAEATGWKLNTVRQYVANGLIPALYLGRKRVVRADVLERICTEGLATRSKKKVQKDS
jgi:hypothetical protein